MREPFRRPATPKDSGNQATQGNERDHAMFTKIALTAIAATMTATIAVSGASAMGGGGGTPRDAFVTVHERDGSSRTISKCGTCGHTRIIHRDRDGKVTKVRPVKKVKKVRRGDRAGRSVPYAINHTDGIMSIGILPGFHIVIGGR